jgi:glyoxylase-like metal-dependent hydrolase (beta-lactamase superfamily II)
MSNPLHWDVFVSDQVLVATRDLPPGVNERRWSPISSALISGQRDALLVDTFITVEQNRKLVDWIVKTGKNLTTIYATHGHGDHFFGVNTIRERFPNARFVALGQVIDVMRKQASSGGSRLILESAFCRANRCEPGDCRATRRNGHRA